MEQSWFYLDNGRRVGPLDTARLLEAIVGSQNPRAVRVWRAGLQEWELAGALQELNSQLPPPTPGVNEKRSSAIAFPQALRVAELFRRLVVLVGVQLLVYAGFAVIGDQSGLVVPIMVLFVGLLATSVALAVTAHKLMTSLDARLPLAWALGMLVPTMNLVVLLGVSTIAQWWCKRFDIPVGFLGPTKEGLNKLRQGQHPAA
jgi:GYF domain 2